MDYSTLVNKYIFTGEIIVENALHIGSGKEDYDFDAPFIKSGNKGYYIPGSSFRGYLRTKIERFVNGNFGLMYDGRELDNMDIKLLFGYTDINNNDFKNQSYSTDEQLEQIKKRLNSNIESKNLKQMMGKIHLADMSVKNGTNEIKRDGIKISRDTGTTEKGAKFDYNVVNKGTVFIFEMILENVYDYQLELIKIGLNDMLNDGDLFGGKISRGIGKCKLKLNNAKYIKSNDKESIKKYIFEGKMSESSTPSILLETNSISLK